MNCTNIIKIKQEIIDKMIQDNMHFGFIITHENTVYNIGYGGMGEWMCRESTVEYSKAVIELLEQKILIKTTKEMRLLCDQSDDTYVIGMVLKLTTKS